MSLSVIALACTFIGATLLLLASAENDENCPEPCTCRREQPGARFIVDCKRKGLKHIPNVTNLHDTVIHRLFLDGNRIQEVESNQFQGVKIKGIQFSDNPLMDIANDAFAGLEDTLEFLSLQRTHLAEVPSAALSSLSNLVTLDMSGVSPLMVLWSGEFQGLSSLEVLWLKGVALIQVEEDAFAGLDSLKVLRMDSCGLHYLPTSINKHLPKLRYLHLDQNTIDYIPDNAFQNLPELETLTLTANRLAGGPNYLSNDAFSGLRNLKELDLSFNEFYSVPHHSFAPLKKVERLRLSDSVISEIHPQSFHGMDALKELDLGGNKISLSHEVLRDVKDTLEVLRIGRTGLTWDTFPHEIIRNLSSLQELDLEGNEFAHVPADAFSGIKAKTISLMYCGIQHTEPNAFRGLKSPVRVKLNWNRITNVTFVHDPCAFEKIELFRNPVHCDCNFRQMAQYNHIQLVGHCATPEEVGGHELTRYVSGIHSYCNSTDLTSGSTCDWYPSLAVGARESTASGASPELLSSYLIVLILLSMKFTHLWVVPRWHIIIYRSFIYFC